MFKNKTFIKIEITLFYININYFVDFISQYVWAETSEA
jgi:hypothetical protein